MSDGISETLINNLSQLAGVRVIARSSSFDDKGKAVDPQEVARALGVSAIVTGRVSQRGDDLVIGVELVDTADRTKSGASSTTARPGPASGAGRHFR